MGTAIRFARADGKEANGYLANAANSDAPGIVEVQEWWGLQDQVRGMCDRRRGRLRRVASAASQCSATALDTLALLMSAS